MAFSLIELMVVIAIVAILAVVAMPYYNSYINRVQVYKMMGVLMSQVSAWEESVATGGPLPLSANNIFPGINDVSFSSTAHPGGQLAYDNIHNLPYPVPVEDRFNWITIHVSSGDGILNNAAITVFPHLGDDGTYTYVCGVWGWDYSPPWAYDHLYDLLKDWKCYPG